MTQIGKVQAGAVVREFVVLLKKFTDQGIVLTDSDPETLDAFVQETEVVLRLLECKTPSVEVFSAIEDYLSSIVNPVCDGEFFSADAPREFVQEFLDSLEIAGSTCAQAASASTLH